MNEQILTTTDIEELRSIGKTIDFLEDDKEVELLNILKREMNQLNDVKLAKMVIIAYDYLLSNKNRFSSARCFSKFEYYLNDFLDISNISGLRNNMINYDDGRNLGDYYRKMSIQEMTIIHRTKYYNLINLFMIIFDIGD